jgi:hypothetical protein
MIDIVETTESNPPFVPFEITFKVNTLQDAQAFHFIFNYRPIYEAIFDLGSIKASQFRAYINSKTDPCPQENVVVRFRSFQQKLTSRINFYAAAITNDDDDTDADFVKQGPNNQTNG